MPTAPVAPTMPTGGGGIEVGGGGMAGPPPIEAPVGPPGGADVLDAEPIITPDPITANEVAALVADGNGGGIQDLAAMPDAARPTQGQVLDSGAPANENGAPNTGEDASSGVGHEKVMGQTDGQNQTGEANVAPAEAPQTEVEFAKAELDEAMNDWDAKDEHREPPDRNSDEWKAWSTNRNDAVADATVNSNVNAGLNTFKKDNPRPDETKDPKGAQEWDKKYSEHEAQLREKEKNKGTEDSAKEADKNEAKKNKKKSEKAEKASLEAQLQTLYIRRQDLINGIDIYHKPGRQNSESDILKLADCQVALQTVEQQIKILEIKLRKRRLKIIGGAAALGAAAFVAKAATADSNNSNRRAA